MTPSKEARELADSLYQPGLRSSEGWGNTLYKKAELIQQALNKARDDALEEAARLCDLLYWPSSREVSIGHAHFVSDFLAKEIRAMKEE